jgi:glycine cleavage system H protein
MSDIPAELRYTKTHEWARLEDDGLVTVGITDYSQALLGDLVYVELPEVNTELAAGEDCGVVESVKAAADLYLPVSGEIIEVNVALSDAPELVNEDPYVDGWLMRIKPMDEAEVDELMDAEEYSEHVESEEH